MNGYLESAEKDIRYLQQGLETRNAGLNVLIAESAITKSFYAMLQAVEYEGVYPKRLTEKTVKNVLVMADEINLPLVDGAFTFINDLCANIRHDSGYVVPEKNYATMLSFMYEIYECAAQLVGVGCNCKRVMPHDSYNQVSELVNVSQIDNKKVMVKEPVVIEPLVTEDSSNTTILGSTEELQEEVQEVTEEETMNAVIEEEPVKEDVVEETKEEERVVKLTSRMSALEAFEQMSAKKHTSTFSIVAPGEGNVR